MSGGERGPGQNVRLPVTAVGRQRTGDFARGMYYLFVRTSLEFRPLDSRQPSCPRNHIEASQDLG